MPSKIDLEVTQGRFDIGETGLVVVHPCVVTGNELSAVVYQSDIIPAGTPIPELQSFDKDGVSSAHDSLKGSKNPLRQAMAATLMNLYLLSPEGLEFRSKLFNRPRGAN